MYDPIKQLLSTIFASIPKAILEEAFLPKSVPIKNTLDYYIHEKIIIGRVLDDCNLYAGKRKRILLQHKHLERVTTPDVYSTLNSAHVGVYRIPPEDREYRDISHVIELLYPFSASGFTSINYPSNTRGGITVSTMAADVIGSQTYEDVSNPPRAILLSGDLIKLDPPQLAHIDWIMVALLKYDENFTNLNVDAIRPLCKLAVAATKAYIHNELLIRMDEAYLVGGQEMVTFKAIIERYEDQNEVYDELLTAFRGGATLDPDEFADIVGFMF